MKEGPGAGNAEWRGSLMEMRNRVCGLRDRDWGSFHRNLTMLSPRVNAAVCMVELEMRVPTHSQQSFLPKNAIYLSYVQMRGLTRMALF